MRTNIRGGKNTEHIRDRKTDLRNLWSLAAGEGFRHNEACAAGGSSACTLRCRYVLIVDVPGACSEDSVTTLRLLDYSA